jgi:lysozyme family protein
MSVPSYDAVKGVYQNLWDTLVPTASHMPELEKIAQRALDHKPAYQAVAQTVWGTPDYWYVVALIDQMEGGGGASTYLGNGQSLSSVTTEVPAGRGPFANFHDGAVDALRYDGLDKVHDWSAASTGYHLEGYNGWGYLSKPVTSPYLASWSNKYTSGKYVADHVYDPNAVSQQPGALTILKVLATLDKTIDLGPAVPAKDTTVTTQATSATPTTLAPPTPTLVSVANPGLAQVMAQLDKLTHVLQAVVDYVPMLAAIPFLGAQVAPLLPFIPAIRAFLDALDKIEASNGDLGTIFAEIEKLIPAITKVLKPSG